MRPEDAFKGRLNIGDAARHNPTGKVFKVVNMVQTDFLGKDMVVFSDDFNYYDISEIDLIS